VDVVYNTDGVAGRCRVATCDSRQEVVHCIAKLDTSVSVDCRMQQLEDSR